MSYFWSLSWDLAFPPNGPADWGTQCSAGSPYDMWQADQSYLNLKQFRTTNEKTQYIDNELVKRGKKPKNIAFHEIPNYNGFQTKFNNNNKKVCI